LEQASWWRTTRSLRPCGIVHPEDAEQFDDAADQAVEESARQEASPNPSCLAKAAIE